MSVDRYSRHLLIEWFDQDFVRNASVLVVGAGAVGNETLKNLALLGIGQIKIIDFDRIETHNLTRSVLFGENDVGLYKAEVAAKAVSRLNPDTKVAACVTDLWDFLTVDQLKRLDAVFCCVDNYEARIRLNRLCLLAGVDLYNSGIDSRFVSIERFPFRSQPGNACYECGLPESVHSHIRERYSCSWLKKRVYEENKIPTTIITSSIAGAKLCALFLHQMHDGCPNGAVRLYTDTIGGNSSVVSLPRNEDCHACHGAESVILKIASRKSLVPVLKEMGLSDEGIVWFSDPVVLGVKCVECGNMQVLNDLAQRYDDALLFCKSCGLTSNHVDVRESLTLQELASAFVEKLLPVKYVWFSVRGQRVVIELEETNG